MVQPHKPIEFRINRFKCREETSLIVVSDESASKLFNLFYSNIIPIFLFLNSQLSSNHIQHVSVILFYTPKISWCEMKEEWIPFILRINILKSREERISIIFVKEHFCTKIFHFFSSKAIPIL